MLSYIRCFNDAGRKIQHKLTEVFNLESDYWQVTAIYVRIIKILTPAGRHYCDAFLQVVLQNLLMCTVCFYSLYYMVVSLCIGLLRYRLTILVQYGWQYFL